MGDGEHLRCACPHCAGPMEFPPELAGAGIDCPHCGAPLNLVEPEPPPPAGERVADPVDANATAPLTASALATALTGRVPRRPVPAAYRIALVLVTLVMVALPAVYAGFVAGVGWCVVRLARDWIGWIRVPAGLERMSGLHLAIHAAGLLLGALVLVFLVKPIFARRARDIRPLALNPASEPLLFAFLNMIADTVGAPRPARVDVDCRLNASAGFRRGLASLAGRDFVLTLGLPLVAAFDLRQLAGVLAHELAHFNQGLGFRLSYIVRGVNAWLARVAYGRDAWDEALERYATQASSPVGRILIGLGRGGIALSRGVAVILMHAGHAVSCLLLRQMEHDADRCQVGLAGSDAFETTLRRNLVLASVARDFYRQLRADWEQHRRLPANLPAALVAAGAGLSEENQERLAGRALAREAGLLDTHPTDAERLQRARDAAVPGVFQLDHPGTALFFRFETLARQATLLHYEEVLGLPRERIEVALEPGERTT